MDTQVLVESRPPSEQLASEPPFRVAYIMSRFPKLTETFILFEVIALEEQGVQVEMYPLLREHAAVMHPEAEPLVKRAHFQPFISWPILRAQLFFLRRNPRAYLAALWVLLRSNLGSWNFFIGGIGIFPKSVYFARMMSEQGVQHVHAHFASHPAAAAFIIHRLAGIPYSFTAHGSDLHVDRHMLCEKVAEAAFVVAISKYNKELIAEECAQRYREKIEVVHCGVDTSIFQPHQKSPPETSSNRPLTLLCVGTLHEVKGQTYLIEACRLLNSRGVEFVCNLVGDGPDRSMLTEQIKNAELDDRVYLLGPQTREQIAELLTRADVVVTPSVPTDRGQREGIPVVSMEAMASGVPVVASAISGIPELVEHEITGLLAPPREPAVLADAIERLHNDAELRDRLGRAGREKVLREFDIHNNGSTLLQHFLVSAQGTPSP